MNDETRVKLAQGLVDHLRAGSASDDTFWAWERVQGMIDGGQIEAAWDVIRDALRLPLESRVVTRIGAGVLESLLESIGPEVMVLLQREAETNDAVIQALRVVNASGFQSDVVNTIRRLVARGHGPE